MDNDQRLTTVEARCTQNSEDIAVLKESEKNQAEDISDLQVAFKSLSEMTQTLHTDATLIKHQLGGQTRVFKGIMLLLVSMLAKSLFELALAPPAQMVGDPAMLEKLDAIEQRLDRGTP